METPLRHRPRLDKHLPNVGRARYAASAVFSRVQRGFPSTICGDSEDVSFGLPALGDATYSVSQALRFVCLLSTPCPDFSVPSGCQRNGSLFALDAFAVSGFARCAMRQTSSSCLRETSWAGQDKTGQHEKTDTYTDRHTLTRHTHTNKKNTNENTTPTHTTHTHALTDTHLQHPYTHTSRSSQGPRSEENTSHANPEQQQDVGSGSRRVSQSQSRRSLRPSGKKSCSTEHHHAHPRQGAHVRRAQLSARDSVHHRTFQKRAVETHPWRSPSATSNKHPLMNKHEKQYRTQTRTHTHTHKHDHTPSITESHPFVSFFFRLVCSQFDMIVSSLRSVL